MSSGKEISKRVTYGFTIIYVVIFIGTIQFFFDENYRNDQYGWLLLIIFWLIRSLHIMLQNLKEGKKKSAIYNSIFAIVVLGFLIWVSTNNIFINN